MQTALEMEHNIYSGWPVLNSYNLEKGHDVLQWKVLWDFSFIKDRDVGYL